MKRLITIVTILLILSISSYLYVNLEKEESPKSISKSLDVVPQNAALIFKFSSLNNAMEIFEFSDTSFMGLSLPEAESLFAFDTADGGMTQGFKEALLKLDSAYVNRDEECGFIIPEVDGDTSEQSTPVIVYYTLNEQFKELPQLFPLFDSTTFTPIDKDSTSWYGDRALDKAADYFLTTKEGYLFLIETKEYQLGLQALESVQNSTPLTQSESYQKLTNQISTNETIFFYATDKWNRSSSTEADKAKAPPFDFRKNFSHVALAFSELKGKVNLELSGLHKQPQQSGDKNNDLLSSPAVLIDKEPVILFETTLENEDILNSLDTLSKFAISDFFHNNNFSKSDFLNSLGKGLGIGMYDAEEFGLQHWNTALSCNLENPKAFREHLNEIYQALPMRVKGFIQEATPDEEYLYKANLIVMSVYIAIKGDDLLITTEEQYIDEMTPGSKKRFKSIRAQEPTLSHYQQGHFYYNLSDAISIIEMLVESSPKKPKIDFKRNMELMKSFQYIWGEYANYGENLYGRISVQTDFDSHVISTFSREVIKAGGEIFQNNVNIARERQKALEEAQQADSLN